MDTLPQWVRAWEGMTGTRGAGCPWVPVTMCIGAGGWVLDARGVGPPAAAVFLLQEVPRTPGTKFKLRTHWVTATIDPTTSLKKNKNFAAV